MIKELVTRFGFEIDDKGLKQLDEGISAIKEGILGLGAALAGEAVGLYELVTHASETAVQLKIMSQETGIAAEKLQELQFRAGLAEVSSEDLNQSMNLLARNLDQARQGSTETVRYFRNLGITMQDLRNPSLNTGQLLEMIGKRFEKMPDGPKKTAAALELFGRSGARMVPFLSNLHRQLDPVNQSLFEMSVITDAQIASGEEFDINLKSLKAGLLGITRTVGFGLIPVATEVIEAMKKWVVQNRQLIVQNLTEFVKGMTAALKITIKIVDALIQSFSGLAHAIGGVRITTEILLGTFAVLSGATVLFGIGKVIMAVQALAGSFALADLAAAAIPIAIGAAMAAIFLIMEDIYSFFNGKKSFTGDLLRILPEIGTLFKTLFEPIFEPIVNIITMITDGVGGWKAIFKELGVLIVNSLLTPLRSVVATVGFLISALGRIPGFSGLKGVGGSVTGFANDYLRLQSPYTNPQIGGVGPQTAVPGAPGGKQTNNDVSVHNEFNFPPGTDPAVVGDKISSSISDGLNDVLRSTNRTTYNGGSY